MAGKRKNNYLIHAGLFILTFITTVLAGAQWTSNQAGPYSIDFLQVGIPYAISILLIISFHEFGHYFAARYHGVDATLPFYIPFPSIPGLLNFGTMGAVIKTRTPVYTKKAMFDIGVAGPLAGFVACLVVLIYGFTNVPPKEFILNIHPDFDSPTYGQGGLQLIFGDSLLFTFFKSIFVKEGMFFPPMDEIYHYPYLCAGWFGLFITSMNLIPVGQLDGGHLSYTMLGEKKAYKLAVFCFALLFVIGAYGLIETFIELPISFGWSGWLFWAIILFLIIKLKHPVIHDEEELDPARKTTGYVALLVFIISFSPTPFIVREVVNFTL